MKNYNKVNTTDNQLKINKYVSELKKNNNIQLKINQKEPFLIK